MGSSGQTPVLHLKAGGGGPWPDAACRAAMIACGIDPDSFGTYDERLKAQKAERDGYRDRVDAKVGKGNAHPSPCEYPKTPQAPCECYKSKEAYDACMTEPGGAGKWLRMNSQSGHLSRDEWYRAKPANPGDKTREDPCANYPPSGGNAGGYGNDSTMAFCTDHVGLSRGQEHWKICKTERQHAKDVKGDPELNGMMPQPSLDKQVDATVDCMVDNKTTGPDGKPVDSLGKLSPEEVERGKRIDAARSKMAQEKADEAAKKGLVPPGSQPTPGTPNDASASDPSKTNREKAKECIKDAWKQAVEQMRQKAVSESSLVSKAKTDAVAKNQKANPPGPGAKKAEDMTSEERDAAFDKLSPAEKEAARQQVKNDMQKFGAEKGLSSDKSTQAGDPAPTKDDCLNYQGAWLFANPDPSGGLRPVQGRAPGAPPPSNTPTTIGTPNGEAD